MKTEPGTLVSEVMNLLEKEYDADLGNYGMPTAIEIEAKIPLLAAAPELLDACRKALSAIQTLATVIPAGQLGNEKFVFAETIEEEIEAAISKAEGK